MTLLLAQKTKQLSTGLTPAQDRDRDRGLYSPVKPQVGPASPSWPHLVRGGAVEDAVAEVAPFRFVEVDQVVQSAVALEGVPGMHDAPVEHGHKERQGPHAEHGLRGQGDELARGIAVHGLVPVHEGEQPCVAVQVVERQDLGVLGVGLVLELPAVRLKERPQGRGV